MMSKEAAITAVGIIPARYASTRFPGKPLAAIAGRPMIYWVYQQAVKARRLQDVLVATDDERIVRAVESFGGKAVLTSPRHATGTDRIAEVATNLNVSVIVNIQGDEPLIAPEAIDRLVEAFAADPSVRMATLCRRAQDVEEIFDPNTVRVVFDRNGDALYFSRAPIPYNRDARSREEWLSQTVYYQHIGVYAYKRDFLLELAGLPQSPLERAEKLEQLRVLENGHRIRVVETDYRPVCVDVPEDVAKVELLMKEMGRIYV